MKVERIIFLVESPFGVRDEKRFGVAVLKRMGYQVEVWDLSGLVLPRSRQQWFESPRLVTPLTVIGLSHFQHLAQTLRSTDACILLTCIDAKQSGACLAIRSALFSTSAVLCAISSGHMPVPPRSRLFLSQLQQVIAHPSRLLSAMDVVAGDFFGFAKRSTDSQAKARSTGEQGDGTRGLDRVWAGTNVANLDAALVDANTDVRFIHTLDFDQVLTVDVESAEAGRYCVFLDSMGPLHPDFYTHQLPFPMTMDSYSAVVRRHIGAVHRQTGLPVVVAAHPRARPGSMQKWFGDLEIAHGRTAELIAQSRVVVSASNSTSLGIAVATRRPISLVAGVILPPETERNVKAFMRALKLTRASRILPDRNWEVPHVNHKAYAQYVARYMKKPGTPKKLFWEVVGEDLSQPGSDDSAVA